jgi:hypothetical protein
MTEEGLSTCRVPEDPASPVTARGYIVACTMFYEWGFAVPAHRFLHSLLQFYGLELHHLTPSGILHMAAFVTLCEPHFNLWNYFFRAQLRQGLCMEAAVLGGVEVFVRSRHGVDPYFHLPMFGPMDEWQKVWFLLRNNIDALLPEFTGSRPVPNPTGGMV